MVRRRRGRTGGTVAPRHSARRVAPSRMAAMSFFSWWISRVLTLRRRQRRARGARGWVGGWGRVVGTVWSALCLCLFSSPLASLMALAALSPVPMLPPVRVCVCVCVMARTARAAGESRGPSRSASRRARRACAAGGADGAARGHPGARASPGHRLHREAPEARASKGEGEGEGREKKGCVGGRWLALLALRPALGRRTFRVCRLSAARSCHAWRPARDQAQRGEWGRSSHGRMR